MVQKDSLKIKDGICLDYGKESIWGEEMSVELCPICSEQLKNCLCFFASEIEERYKSLGGRYITIV